MSVKRAQAEIDRQELLDWMAIYDDDPWGERRMDTRMAVLASQVANLSTLVIRAMGYKAPKQYRPDDFMPQVHRAHRAPQTPEQQMAIMRMFTLASGGTITRDHRRQPERQS